MAMTKIFPDEVCCAVFVESIGRIMYLLGVKIVLFGRFVDVFVGVWVGCSGGG